MGVCSKTRSSGSPDPRECLIGFKTAADQGIKTGFSDRLMVHDTRDRHLCLSASHRFTRLGRAAVGSRMKAGFVCGKTKKTVY